MCLFIDTVLNNYTRAAKLAGYSDIVNCRSILGIFFGCLCIWNFGFQGVVFYIPKAVLVLNSYFNCWGVFSLGVSSW